MRAGDLDKQVTILERAEVTEGTFGTKTLTWNEVETVWAKVKDILPDRAGRVADSINIQRRPCRIEMRYRSDVTQANRFQIDGRQLRIVSGPVEIGRREGVAFIAEELTVEGQQP